MDGGTVVIRLIANAKGVAAGVGQGNAAIRGFAANAKAVGARMVGVGTSMTKWVTLPILAAGAAAAKFSLDFEKSMTNIEALVGIPAKAIPKIKAQILDLAGEVGRSPRELGEAYYFLASSGLSATDSLKALRASALASAAGLGDTKVIADAVSSALNAYGSKVLDATKATDILLAAVREGKSEPEEFAGSIGRVIPLAEKMGVSFGEVAGMMAAMSLNGTNANEAVTQITAALSTAIKPTKQGTDALKSIGMDYEGLRKSIADKGLIQTFDALDKAFKGNVESLGAVFGNLRALRGVMTLTGPSMKKYLQIVRDVSAASGDTARAAEIALSKPGGKLQKAWAAVQASIIKAGDIIVPVFVQIAEKVASVAKAFGELPKGTQETIVKLLALVAVAGPVLSMIGKISLGVSALSKVYVGLRTALLGAAAAQALMAGTGAGGGLVAAGASATRAAAGVHTFYVASSGAASTATALATSGVSAGVAMTALGVSAGAAAVTMGALAVAAFKVHNLMVKIQSDSTVAGTVAADLADMVKGIGREMGETVSKMASGAMAMGKGQEYLGGFIDTLKKVRVEAVKVGDAKMIAQIDKLIGGYKGLQGQFVKLGGIGFKVGAGVRDIGLVNTAITTVKGNIAGLEDRLTVLGKMKPTPKVKADITATKTALAKAEAELKRLNGMKTNPKVTANTGAALSGIQSVLAYLDRVQSKTITLTTVTKSIGAGRHSGGILTGPHSGYPATLHGRELVLPLDHPVLIPRLLTNAGIPTTPLAGIPSMTGGANRSAPASGGAVINNTINVNAPVYGVDDLHDVIHDATMAAMEEAQVAEGRSARGSVR